MLLRRPVRPRQPVPAPGLRPLAAAVAVVFLSAVVALPAVSAPGPQRPSIAAPTAAVGAHLRFPPLASGAPAPDESGSVIVPPPAVFEGDRTARASSGREEARARVGGDVLPGPGTWAVVVGVNDYPGEAYDLRSAVNDARDVDRALEGLGVPRANRLVLVDEQATADTILRALGWLADHAEADAVAVFFYAGHVRKEATGREVLVGSDGSVVSDAVLAARLDAVPASRAWVVVAGCYGGGFDEVVRPGRILTAAAAADELAYENLDLGRSYLVEYMVRRAMIEGVASSSVEAAFAFARAQISSEHPKRVPVQVDAVPGNLDLRPRPVPPPAAESPRPPAPPASSGSPPPPPPGEPTSPPPPSQNQCLIGLVGCGTGSLGTRRG